MQLRPVFILHSIKRWACNNLRLRGVRSVNFKSSFFSWNGTFEIWRARKPVGHVYGITPLLVWTGGADIAWTRQSRN